MVSAQTPPHRADPGDSRGLSEEEAATRLRRDGPNEIPAAAGRTKLRIVLEVLREPMFALLLGAAAIYLVLGELIDAATLVAFATFSVVITAVQEGRSERALESLRSLASPRALVLREGRYRRIPGREVVRDDLIVLGEGDRVPADATIVSRDELQVDESLLTGESFPVAKRAVDAAPVSTVLSGTLVVRGNATAVVTAIGAESEMGKIGRALGNIEREPPRLHAEIRRIVRVAAVMGISVSALTAALMVLTSGEWLAAALAGIAIGMSMLPEEFPLVLTVFTVMGAWRIARAGVLTRRAAAIEVLGAATVLCTDKTGTITQNRMEVLFLRGGSGAWRSVGAGAEAGSTAQYADLLKVAALASSIDTPDPIDRAVIEFAVRHGIDARAGNLEVVGHDGPEAAFPGVVYVWRREADGTALAAAKGAPETITALCHLSEGQGAEVRAAVDETARQGIRILAVARAFSATPHTPAREMPYEFLGLIGFADPLRPGVPSAVRECRSAGVRVVMITGDHAATAQTIARQAGLNADLVVTGAEIANFDDAALRECVRRADVFARTTPDQKLRIVTALKANGEIVAMTGDGVNDAPSLKAAHIGVAMGARGTDVAREAASIVLIDDRFEAIVDTIRLGRRTFDNLRKTMTYIVAVHVPIAALALVPLAFGSQLVLTPMLIAFLEMVIDPACSVVLEAEREEADVMRRPPRDPRSPLLGPGLLAWGLIQGSLSAVVVAGIFVAARSIDLPELELRSLAFTSLVTTNLALIFANRSFSSSLKSLLRPNRSLWIGLGVVISMLAVVLFWPEARTIAHLGPLHLDDVTVCAGSSLTLFVVLQSIKPAWRRHYET